VVSNSGKTFNGGKFRTASISNLLAEFGEDLSFFVHKEKEEKEREKENAKNKGKGKEKEKDKGKGKGKDAPRKPVPIEVITRKDKGIF